MIKPLHKTVLSTAILACMGLPAQAQQSELVLEEVIVTAQKRVETLSETPMTVSVMTATQIEQYGAFSLNEINNLTTGLAISGSGVDYDLAVRGLGSDLNAPLTPRLTFYVDGNYFAQPRGILTGLFDIGQIEVLRGPQGTLYGQTSPAGAVTIRSQSPNLSEMDGYIRQSFTEHDGSNTQFGVSLPIIEDKLGVRLSGLYDTNENPDVENVTLDRQAENETRAFRAVVAWEATDSLSLRFAYWDIEDNNDIDPMVQGNGFDVDDRIAVADKDSFIENTTDLLSVEVNYNFANDLELTFIASDQNNRIVRDYDEDASEVLSTNVIVDSNVDDVQTYELRLASQGNDLWDWTIGAFNTTTDSLTEVYVDTYLAVAPGLNVFADIANPAYLANETKAIFSHNSIYLSDKSTLTIGLRYSESERDGRQPFTGSYFLLLPDGTQLPVGGAELEGIPAELRTDEYDAITGTLKYQYQFTDDLMVYGSYDRGWVAGNVNVARTIIPPVFLAFDDETADNFELGFKWELFGSRGLWNFAAYYQVYSDFHRNAEQVSYRTVDGSVDLESPVVTVDEAESYGFDSDFTYLLAQNWTLHVGLSYNQAELTDARNTPCTNGEPIGEEIFSFNTCDLTGERAGAEPEWSANLASEYSHTIGDKLEWYLRGLVNAESEYYSLSERKDLDSYSKLDAYLGFRSISGSWDVNIWVKNLTDETAVLKSEIRGDIPDYAAGTQVSNPYVWIRRSLDPRTAGVTLSYNF
ncbi:TonB-dependent receptor plug domain-containing protein [Parahaliea maris]|uniref:TonB-dependent receptor plug domain-containing protein n=1 Tax=Parahaliea maris TaxID=2716870 RepID=A0A5C9A5J6_9GAMM|nr:TonB-dependent receptor [Parahaliea maris]TXS96175.1 TonB-dependent receptor plug domain-containing protein [Parahaliea maris]